MAVVYSWKLGSNNYGYIVKPKEHNKALVIRGGEPLSGSDLNDVRDWASTIDVTNQGDRKVYETQLERLKAEIRANGLNVELASADDYLNMEGDCADLRGPAGPRGPKGDPGEPGRVGDRGPMGPVGPRGKSEMDMMFVTLYYASDNIANGPASAPNEPYDTDDPGPVYDFDNNKLIIPAGGNCAGWDENDEKPGFLWKTDRMFYKAEKYDRTKSWSKPMRITPKDGEPGADGVNIEFVYHVEPNDVTGKEPAMPSRQISGSKNWISEDGNVIWNDHPAGISENQKIEWMCCRVKDEKGEWGVWEGPSIWSRWGDNGQDGDGVEYIYHRNNGTGIRPIDSPSSISPEEAGFQDSDYLPGVNGLYKGRQWTDEPKGVEAEFEKSFEWVCVRKKVNGKWEAFSNPKLWSHYGEKGDNGNSIVMKYAVSDGVEEMPPINQESNNPGSNWNGSVKNLLKAYRPGENVLWGTQALVNYKGELLKDENGDPIPWEDPFLLTGKNGVTPSYKMYFFHLEEEDENGKKKAPAAPDGIHSITDNDLNNLESQGWIDYPDKPGVWYQIVATIDGITKKVGKWGSVQPLTGVGTGLEVRFKKTETRVKASEVEINVTERYPGEGWYLPDDPKADFDIVEDQTLWESMVHLDRNDNMLDNWCTPFPVSGERGPQGEQGATGPQGIPGAGYSLRFKLGPDSVEKWPDGFWIDEWAGFIDVEQHGWMKEQPKIKNTTSKDRMYIWAVQARTHFVRVPDTDDPSKFHLEEEFEETGENRGWSDPFLTTGVNGIDGTPGKKAPVIYPEGVYDPDKVYYATDKKAPYVYDSSTGEYFVLNYVEDGWGWWGGSTGHTGTEAKEIITPEGKVLTAPTQKGKTPAEMYVEGYSNYWEMFEQFDAVYAKVGIIANGLIGEAVFNNEFMFSQKGIVDTDSGGKDAVSFTTHYERFLDQYDYTRETGYINKITKEKLGFKKYTTDIYPDITKEFYLSTLAYSEDVCLNYSCGKKSIEWSDSDILPEKRPSWLPGTRIILGIPCSSEGENKGKYFMSYQVIIDRNTLKPLYATDTPIKNENYWICEEGSFYKDEYVPISPDPYAFVDKVDENGNGTIRCGFMPNMCINFSTGEMWLAAGGMYIDSEGKTHWGEYKGGKNPIGHIETGISGLTETVKTNINEIKNLGSDNFIYPSEKSILKQFAAEIKNEKEKVVENGKNIYTGLETKNYESAYGNVMQYLFGNNQEDPEKSKTENSLLYNMSIETNITDYSFKFSENDTLSGREAYNRIFDDFYAQRSELFKEIDNKVNESVLIMGKDGFITKKEKKELNKELSEIHAEQLSISQNMTLLGINYEVPDKDNSFKITVPGEEGTFTVLKKTIGDAYEELKDFLANTVKIDDLNTDTDITKSSNILYDGKKITPVTAYYVYFNAYFEAKKKCTELIDAQINSDINDLASDKVISDADKLVLKEELSAFEQEKLNIKANLDKLGVDTTTPESVFVKYSIELENNLKKYLTSGGTSESYTVLTGDNKTESLTNVVELNINAKGSTKNIDPEHYKKIFKSFYIARDKATRRITEKLNQDIETVDSKVDVLVTKISNIAEDKVIDAVEMVTLRNEWERINSEYTYLTSSAGVRSITISNDYNKAYIDLKDLLLGTFDETGKHLTDGILQTKDDKNRTTYKFGDITDDFSHFEIRFSNYYKQSEILKKIIDARDGSDISNIASDGYLTNAEKRELENERLAFEQEKIALLASAAKYGLSGDSKYKEYEDEWDVLNDYLIALTEPNNTSVKKDTFTTNLTNYYTKRKNLQEIIDSAISNYASDGYLTPAEKASLVNVYKDICKEFKTNCRLLGLSDTSAASGDAYCVAFHELEDYLIKTLGITNAKLVGSNVDRTVYNSKFEEYYAARDKAEEAIKKKNDEDVVNKIQDEIGKIPPPKTDLEYIKQSLGPNADTEINEGVILTNLLGVTDTTSSGANANVVGFLNGSKVYGVDTKEQGFHPGAPIKPEEGGDTPGIETGTVYVSPSLESGLTVNKESIISFTVRTNDNTYLETKSCDVMMLFRGLEFNNVPKTAFSVLCLQNIDKYYADTVSFTEADWAGKNSITAQMVVKKKLIYGNDGVLSVSVMSTALSDESEKKNISLILSAGIPDKGPNGETGLKERCNYGKTRIYEDGSTHLANDTAVFYPDGTGHIGNNYAGMTKEDGTLVYPIEWFKDGRVIIDQKTFGEIEVKKLDTIPNSENNKIVIQDNFICAFSNNDSVGAGENTLYVTGDNIFSDKRKSSSYREEGPIVKNITGNTTCKSSVSGVTGNSNLSGGYKKTAVAGSKLQIERQNYEEVISGADPIDGGSGKILRIKVNGASMNFNVYIDNMVSPRITVSKLKDKGTYTFIFTMPYLEIQEAKGSSSGPESKEWKTIKTEGKKTFSGFSSRAIVLPDGPIIRPDFDLSERYISWTGNQNFNDFIMAVETALDGSYFNSDHVINILTKPGYCYRARAIYSFEMDFDEIEYFTPSLNTDLPASAMTCEVKYDVANNAGSVEFDCSIHGSRIGKDGLDICFGDGVQMCAKNQNNSSEFLIENNGYGIKVNSDGVRLKLGNSKYQRIVIETDGNNKQWLKLE